ncbi:hypothetical protein [Nitrosomonas sp. Nm132]
MGVAQNAVFHALRKLRVSYKKTETFQSGRRHMAYLSGEDCGI